MEDRAGFLRYPRREARKEGVRQRVHHCHEYEQLMLHSQALFPFSVRGAEARTGMLQGICGSC